MLEDHGVEFDYRDSRRDPLSKQEVRGLLKKPGVLAADVLRRKDRAFHELGLTGDEPQAELIGHIAEHPTLLQRPIGIRGSRAVVGRPIDRLLEL